MRIDRAGLGEGSGVGRQGPMCPPFNEHLELQWRVSPPLCQRHASPHGEIEATFFGRALQYLDRFNDLTGPVHQLASTRLTTFSLSSTPSPGAVGGVMKPPARLSGSTRMSA